jgi:protein-S-isoprenylcysteine O-methyltransferase Ste14
MAHHRCEKDAYAQREDLTGEHTISDTGQIVFACLFAVTWILDTFFFKFTIFLNHYVSLGIRIPLAAILLVVSAYLARRGLSIVFGEERETPSVIRKSVFNFVRHPIYLSEILLYLGLLMLSISLAALAVWIAAILFLNHISRFEERLLVARFGEEYENYMRDVPMWFPRLFRK